MERENMLNEEREMLHEEFKTLHNKLMEFLNNENVSVFENINKKYEIDTFVRMTVGIYEILERSK